MRDNRDILDKLRWLSNDMEYMEVPGEWLLPVTEAHSIIVRERDEIERLRADNQKAALEYLGQIGQLSDENTRLRAALLEIAKYEIDEGCRCSACQHSAIASAALETREAGVSSEDKS